MVVAEEEVVERVALHRAEAPAGERADDVELIVGGCLALHLAHGELAGEQVGRQLIEVALGDDELLVGLVVGGAIDEAALAVVVIRGQELAQRGDHLQFALAQVALPGEEAVVLTLHLGGVVGAPAVGRGVADEVERRRDGLVGGEGEGLRLGLHLVEALDEGLDAGLDLHLATDGGAELMAQDVVQLLVGGGPVVALRLMVDGHVGSHEAGAGLSQLEGIADTVARMEIVAAGPLQGQGVGPVAELGERGGLLVGRQGEGRRPLVELGVVVVRAAGEGEACHEGDGPEQAMVLLDSFHICQYHLLLRPEVSVVVFHRCTDCFPGVNNLYTAGIQMSNEQTTVICL